MMPSSTNSAPLQDFPVVTERDLRELWRLYRDANVRRLILEVHLARAMIFESHTDALSAQYAMWRKQEEELKAQLHKVIATDGDSIWNIVLGDVQKLRESGGDVYIAGHTNNGNYRVYLGSF